MGFKHVYAPTRGEVHSIPSTLLPPEASTFTQGIYLRDGVVSSDFGHTAFPTVGNTTTNALNGSVMRIDQFYTLDGLSRLLCFTTTNLYQYNTTTGTWDCVTFGNEIDDCEAAWDAQANVTSTADTTIKLRDSKSAKHVIAAAFTTGIVSSEDDLQVADISDATNTHLVFWIRANAAVASDVLRLRLSEQAAGGVGATWAEYTIPALVADTWQHVSVAIASPVDDDGGTYPDDLNALASVALVAQSDPGAITVYLDDIRTSNQFTGDTDNRFSTAIMSDTFVFTNGVDAIGKITAVGAVLTVGFLTTTLAAGTISTSEIALAFKDHMIFMQNTENAADAPQRVSWSNIGKIEDYVGGTAGYQDIVDDSSFIMSAAILTENVVIIYKERAIVEMTWVGGNTPFRFRTMVSGTGAYCKEGVTEAAGGHLVFGPDVIYLYKGGLEIQVMDDMVRKTLYGRMDPTYSPRAFMISVEEDNEVQLWIPAGSAYPDEVWCLGTLQDNWYRKDRTMTGFGFYEEQDTLTIGELVGVIGDQDWRFGEMLTKAAAPITLVGDSSGYVYKLDKLTLNNAGTAITNEFQTPDFVLPDTPEYMNQYMRVNQLKFEAKGNSVTTFWSSDGGASWNPTTGGGNHTTTLSGTWKDYQQDFDCVVKRIRFKFYNNTVSSKFDLRYYGFNWMMRSSRV